MFHLPHEPQLDWKSSVGLYNNESVLGTSLPRSLKLQGCGYYYTHLVRLTRVCNARGFFGAAP